MSKLMTSLCFAFILAFSLVSAEPFIHASPDLPIWEADNRTLYKITLFGDATMGESFNPDGVRISYEDIVDPRHVYIFHLDHVDFAPRSDLFSDVTSNYLSPQRNLLSRTSFPHSINGRTGEIAYLWYRVDMNFHGGGLWPTFVSLPIVDGSYTSLESGEETQYSVYVISDLFRVLPHSEDDSPGDDGGDHACPIGQTCPSYHASSVSISPSRVCHAGQSC